MEGRSINKLLVALCVFAFGSASALADDFDTKPISNMTTEEAQAARSAAKAKWDKMTPEEKAAVKRGMAMKMATNRREEITALESPLVGDPTIPLTECEKQKYEQMYEQNVWGPKRAAAHPILCKPDRPPTKAERQRELEESSKQHQQ